jgi:hypothetical protein
MPRRSGSERALPLGALIAAGLISFAAAGTIPHDGLHPLALLAALLPLQLAALLYVFARAPGA